MRGFVTLLLLAVLLLSGYAYWRVAGMEKDVKQLKSVVLKGLPPDRAGKGDPKALLAEAIASSRRAREYLDRGDTKKARRELSVSIQKLAEASKASKGFGWDGSGELRNAWQEAAREMNRLWKQFAAQKKPK